MRLQSYRNESCGDICEQTTWVWQPPRNIGKHLVLTLCKSLCLIHYLVHLLTMNKDHTSKPYVILLICRMVQ